MSSFKTTLENLPQAAAWLLETAAGRKKFAFNAGMGAGKTTLIAALCKALGSQDPVSSPTYALHNIYEYPGGVINHFDLYRLQSPQEAFDIGIEDYLYDDDYCFLEWPQILAPLPAEGLVSITITTDSETERTLRVELG